MSMSVQEWARKPRVSLPASSAKVYHVCFQRLYHLSAISNIQNEALFSLFLTPNAVGDAEMTLGGIDTTKFTGRNDHTIYHNHIC